VLGRANRKRVMIVILTEGAERGGVPYRVAAGTKDPPFREPFSSP
jgi:hypothetical protein